MFYFSDKIWGIINSTLTFVYLFLFDQILFIFRRNISQFCISKIVLVWQMVDFYFEKSLIFRPKKWPFFQIWKVSYSLTMMSIHFLNKSTPIFKTKYFFLPSLIQFVILKSRYFYFLHFLPNFASQFMMLCFKFSNTILFICLLC